MRFLTLFLLITAFACKNKPSDNDTSWREVDFEPATKVESPQPGASPYVFTDTILVSLGAKDFAAVLKSKPNMPILDLRTEAKFKTGHVWRSVSMDADAKDFSKQLSGFGRNQEYAVYCQDGSKSFKVAEEMKRLGFYRIYHLQKGLNFWGESEQALQLK